MENEITFFLVRHGEAENNVLSILNSEPEREKYSLTARGQKQIAETAQFLSAAHADALISSPMERTKETAEIISHAVGLPIRFDDRLCESGMGMYNGKPQRELLKKYPEPEMRLSPDPKDGTESFLDLRGRLMSFLDDIKGSYAGKKVIIVSHGDTLEQLHGILTNESPGVSALGWSPEKGSCKEVVWKI